MFSILIVSLINLSYGFDQIVYAESLDELKGLLLEQQQTREFEELCHQELATDKFPRHCIVATELAALKMQSRQQWQQAWLRLSESCVQYSDQLTDTDEISKIMGTGELSAACRQSLQSRFADLRYIEDH